MAKLTAKQQAFCEEYMVDLNATQAAIRAGYSAATAQEQSSRLLSKVMVKAHVAELQAVVSKRVHIDQDMVIQGLLHEAHYTGPGAAPSARVAAWAHLGKHQGMFTDKVEHSGIDGNPPEFRITIVDPPKRDRH